VFISERPIVLAVDERGRLHKDGGAAIEYRDGYKQYYLHGVSVPEYLAVAPSEELAPADITQYTNVEVRTQFIKKLGIEKLVADGTEKDRDGDYQLIDMGDIIGATYSPYLVMKNPSTGEIHAEGVHPDCQTIQQAINWRAGDINQNWSPAVLS